MGSSSSKSDKIKENISSISSQELENIITKCQNKCNELLSKGKDSIIHLKEELIPYLSQKDLSSSKEKIKAIIKQEDYIMIYNVLNRIFSIIKENSEKIISTNQCPNELRILDSIIYSESRLKIEELKELKEKIKEIYGSDYIFKCENNEDNYVNEVLVQKLKENIISEDLLKNRLKDICKEKNINYDFLGLHESVSPSESLEQSIKSSIRRSQLYHSLKSNSSIKDSAINSIKESQSLIELIDKEKQILGEIQKKNEEIESSWDENIDRKCYEINKIENWADSFYNLKTGIILEKFKELISKSEYKTFFEGLNYEYGINNYPLDVNKAFEIYKNAANNSTDTLSMYRLYHIYKKDFKKFNIKSRNHILEKFYIMKCWAYLTHKERKSELFNKFNILLEIEALILDEENDSVYPWYTGFFYFLKTNYDFLDLNKDDILMTEVLIHYSFSQIPVTDEKLEALDETLKKLSDKYNPNAMYNYALIFYDDDNAEYCDQCYEKLYENNYYRYFVDYASKLPYEIKTLNILKKSISHGYYSHIKTFFQIFMEINSNQLTFINYTSFTSTFKSGLMYALKGLIDLIIFDNYEELISFNYMRNILIKHHKFGDQLKTEIDPILKEIINYFMKFFEGSNEDNKNTVFSAVMSAPNF